MYDTLPVAVFLFSTTFSVVSGLLAIFLRRERDINERHERVLATLRGEILTLKSQVAILMQFARSSGGIAISAGGDVDVGQFTGGDSDSTSSVWSERK